MTTESDTTESDLLAKAEAAIACGDYRQAITQHLELLERLSQQNPEAMLAWRDGPYAELLMAAATHTLALAAQHHFTAALDLIQFIAPYFGTSEEMIQGLESVRANCLERILYTRSSPQATDVLLCCAEAQNEALQVPLAAALRELGVLVATEPVVVSSRSSEAELAELVTASDTVVVLLSPAFFAAAWPQETLHRLLQRTGAAVQVLPVWHRITLSEVRAASEPFEKTLAFDTARSSLAQIAQSIADIVRPDLASGALHKLLWSSFLQGKTLGEGVTEFELPLRHASLDEELIARIRLIRAALLDGFRQTMASWVDGFSRELEPHQAIAEWGRLAEAFQDARSLQRQLNTNEAAALAQLLPADGDAAILELMRESYLEFARYPSAHLFKLIWLASQPMSRHLDVGFSAEVLGIAMSLLQNNLNTEPVEDDFESQWHRDTAVDVQTVNWQVEGEDFSHGLLHTEEERPWTKPWDVFISHASEDKTQLVRPLADALQEYGIKVWYDAFNMRPGCSLGHSIDAGIAGAEFGIVVLSPHFIAKAWPRYEFDALCQRRTEQGERLIPLWHGLVPENRPAWTSALAPEKCLDTAAQPLTALTMQIVEWVRPDVAQYTQRRLAYAAMLERQAQGQLKTEQVKSSQIAPSPRRYARLPASLVERVQLLRAVLDEVAPHSIEYWLDGFLRDYTPERQIAFWEHLAAMYQEAICVIDWWQERSQPRGAKATRRGVKVDHHDVYKMSILLTQATALEHLAEFRRKYPEEIVNIVLGILESPTVIEVLGE